MIALLVDWVLQPLGAVALLSLVALASLMRPGAAGAVPRLAAFAATLVLWVAGSPVPANALVERLEIARSGPPDCTGVVPSGTEGTTGAAVGGSVGEASTEGRNDGGAPPLPMVVPGGGMDAWRKSDSAYELLHRDSLQRVERALDLATPATRFHLLGGGDNGRTLAGLMARVLSDRGVAETRIVLETTSRSTRENAAELARALPPAEHPRIHLVTSALHLARATRVFERAGYRVCGTGVGSVAAPAAGLVGWMPWLSAFRRTTLAWRELLATLADRRHG